MATSGAPTAAPRRRRRRRRGQLAWAGAGETEGARRLPPPPGPQVLGLRRPGSREQLSGRRRTARSPRGGQPAGVAEPAPRRAQPQRGPVGAPHRRRPPWGGGLGAGRPGPPSWARSPSAAPGAAEPPPPPPASKFGRSEPRAPRDAGAVLLPSARPVSGTLGSDADGCDLSCVVLCVHRQDR